MTYRSTPPIEPPARLPPLLRWWEIAGLLFLLSTWAGVCCFLIVDVDAPINVEVRSDPCDALDGSIPEDAAACSAAEQCATLGQACVCQRCVEVL